MIKAVIFDIDNTLLDFMKMKRTSVESAVDSMIDAGLKINRNNLIEEINKVYLKEGIEDQLVFDKVLVNILGQIDYRILAAGIIGYRRAKEGSMVLYPHVKHTLIELIRMGLKIAAISDAPRLPVWMRIVTLDLHHYFDHVITFDDTGEKKPSPEPFLLGLKKLGISSGEAIMVGDWAERDIAGAKKVGMKTAFARYGNEFGTKESNADYDLSDIIEITEIIKNINKQDGQHVIP